MPSNSTKFRQEMIALLGKIIGEGPITPELQSQSLMMFTTILQHPGDLEAGTALVAEAAPDFTETAAVGNRRLVYIHGICPHASGFSSPWWNALQPFVPTAFGPGALGNTRLEVLWSNLVNQGLAVMAAAGGIDGPTGVAALEQARLQAAAEIKDALRDRADQHMPINPAPANALGAAPSTGAAPLGDISIPGFNCIDDFSIYLTNSHVRQLIIDRFTAVVRPELVAGHELDIISHSWGTVVAYEGLRQLEDEGQIAPRVRNFFTVGAALSIGPVKLRLRPANKDGRKPASVQRWINLDAYCDLVGGSLQGRPYAVDSEFLNLDPFGCQNLLGLVNPQCSHSSYFQSGNTAVNRDIFARFIN